MSKTDSALILAGGESKRLGYDKKLLKFNGISIMNNLIEKLQLIFDEVLVSSNDGFVNEKAITLRDDVGIGPLAGIYQGLKYCKSECLYVIACDMPFISVEYINYIKNIMQTRQIDACIACCDNGFYEPFNSIFSKSCLEPIYEALIHQEYKIRTVLDRLNIHIVKPEIIKTFNDQLNCKGNMFSNINYREDLEHLTVDQV